MALTESHADLLFIAVWGQGLIALFLTGLLAYYYRLHRRPLYRLWASSFGTVLPYVLGGGASLALALDNVPASNPWRFGWMTLALAAAHAQVAWLVLGTWTLKRDSAPSAALEAFVVGGAALLGVLLATGYAATGVEQEAAMLIRLGWLYGLLGAAFLACGLRVGWAGADLRLAGIALALFGVVKLALLGLIVFDPATATMITAQTLATIELAGFACAGLALAMALVSGERARIEAVEANLASLLRFDPVTGLPNRARLIELWPSLVGTPGALVAIELDGLERAAAQVPRVRFERALRLVASRLTHEFGIDRVAELERERFVVVLSGDLESSRERARGVMQVIEGALDATLPQHEVLPAAGLAIFRGEAELSQVLARAISACEQARRSGGARLIDADRSPSLNTDRVVTLRGLRAAIERREFEMMYQPIVDSRTRRLLGFEALVRWRHPEEGQIGSGRFVESAERFGLAAALDEQALSLALDSIVAWRRLGLRVPRVAINLSAASLESPRLAAGVLRHLEQRNLPSTQIAVELTESAAVGDYGVCRQNLIALSNAGVAVSLDDFGTGFSQVAHLRELPVNTIKLDKSFLGRVERDPRDAALVRGLAQLARSLDLLVVAEGIEREAQIAFAIDCGIDALQGYLISPPLDSDAALQRIRDDQAQANPAQRA